MIVNSGDNEIIPSVKLSGCVVKPFNFEVFPFKTKSINCLSESFFPKISNETLKPQFLKSEHPTAVLTLHQIVLLTFRALAFLPTFAVLFFTEGSRFFFSFTSSFSSWSVKALPFRQQPFL